MWDADGGEAARCYAEKPYGHYKEEVYPLFAGILDGLGDGVRVLDVGAGPGHMAFEFYKARPGSQLRFALLSFAEVMSPKGRTRRNAGCAETTRIGCMTGSAASASDVWGAGL